MKNNSLDTKIFALFFLKLKFLLYVSKRVVVILFRKERNIELLELTFSDKFLFENSYLIIQYRFKNALYYQFDDLKTIENQLKIFDISNFKNDFKLVVYGLYEKKVYSIKVNPKNKIHNQNFKTEIHNFKSALFFFDIPNLKSNNVFVKELQSNINRKVISVEKQQINIQSYPFNQSEFL